MYSGNQASKNISSDNINSLEKFQNNLTKNFNKNRNFSFSNTFGFSNFKNNNDNFVLGSTDVMSTSFEIDYEVNNFFGNGVGTATYQTKNITG